MSVDTGGLGAEGATESVHSFVTFLWMASHRQGQESTKLRPQFFIGDYQAVEVQHILKLHLI